MTVYKDGRCEQVVELRITLQFEKDHEYVYQRHHVQSYDARTHIDGFLESCEGRDVSWTASRCHRDVPRLRELRTRRPNERFWEVVLVAKCVLETPNPCASISMERRRSVSRRR